MRDVWCAVLENTALLDGEPDNSEKLRPAWPVQWVHIQISRKLLVRCQKYVCCARLARLTMSRARMTHDFVSLVQQARTWRRQGQGAQACVFSVMLGRFPLCLAHGTAAFVNRVIAGGIQQRRVQTAARHAWPVLLARTLRNWLPQVATCACPANPARFRTRRDAPHNWLVWLAQPVSIRCTQKLVPHLIV